MLSDNVDRFVALLFDETSETDPPGPLASRHGLKSWLHALLEDAIANNGSSHLAATDTIGRSAVKRPN